MPDPRDKPPAPANGREGVQGGERDVAADLQTTPKVPADSTSSGEAGLRGDEERSGDRTGGMGGEG